MAHSAAERLEILHRINTRLAALIAFNEEHKGAPWTKTDATEHMALLKHWHKAVQELDAFEHPLPSSTPRGGTAH